MKRGIPCITSHQNKKVNIVLHKHATYMNSTLIQANQNILKDIKPSLLGKYQFENACLAATAVQYLKGFSVSDQNIKTGIEQTCWFGRNEIIQKNPTIIFDVGHNESGILAFLDYFNSLDNIGTLSLIHI